MHWYRPSVAEDRLPPTEKQTLIMAVVWLGPVALASLLPFSDYGTHIHLLLIFTKGYLLDWGFHFMTRALQKYKPYTN